MLRMDQVAKILKRDVLKILMPSSEISFGCLFTTFIELKRQPI